MPKPTMKNSHPPKKSPRRAAAPLLLFTGGFTIGDFTIRPSQRSDKISIDHISGEGGDFDRETFAKHLSNAVAEFYNDCF